MNRTPRIHLLAIAVATAALAGEVATAAAPGATPATPATMPPPPVQPAPPVPPAPATPPAPPSPEALDARLEAAKRRLDAAAREVAELSMAAGTGRGDRLVFVGETPRRAILGLQIDPASGRDGARVLQVSPGGPAAAAGVRSGDVLVAIGGAALRGRDDPARAVVEQMAGVQPDQKLELKLLRDGRTRSVEVTPRRSPMPFAVAGPAAIPLPAPPEGPAVFEWRGDAPSVAGLELASLSAKLGGYFGTAEGVLVVRAPQQAAWQLEDGDVILAIDGRQPTSGAHASRILRSYQAGETLKLRVMRQRKPLELRVAVPEPEAFPGPRVKVVRMRRLERDGESAPDAGGGEARVELPAP